MQISPSRSFSPTASPGFETWERTLKTSRRWRAELKSGKRHGPERFASFADLENLISTGLPATTMIIDGAIYSLDKRRRPQFRNLLFDRGKYPCFMAKECSKRR
jgi:hypothetical protein